MSSLMEEYMPLEDYLGAVSDSEFDDNRGRIIDFILVYKETSSAKMNRYREKFLSNLSACCNENGGLEWDEFPLLGGSNINFIKIHAPIDLLYDLAEEFQMKMPTHPNNISAEHWLWNAVGQFFKDFQYRSTSKRVHYLVLPFKKERLSEFLHHDCPNLFFTSAERSRLVYHILQKIEFGDLPTEVGLGNLLHKGVFQDAFPLHEGSILKNQNIPPMSKRQLLQKHWASFKCLFRPQPIDEIKEYFGEKIAFYFAWLGFYTGFLLPAAVLGVAVFGYGVFASLTSDVVKESCSDPPRLKRAGGHLFYMCPICDKLCSYYLLSSTCILAKISNFFDNDMTPLFAVFMSLWATMFLEFWKRRQISLAYKWNSIGSKSSEEEIRPEYNATSGIMKQNPVTGMHESYPNISFLKNMLRVVGSGGTILTFIAMILITVVGVNIFRAVFTIILIASRDYIVHERADIIAVIAAAFINLIAINILKFFYKKVAFVLTKCENPRTRSDFVDSFTIKMFWFQFFNRYSSIIYIALLKEEFITGTPGNYHRFGVAKFRLDGCKNHGGCFLQLAIQLTVIMVGQQFIDNLFETLLPTVLHHFRKKKMKKVVDIKANELPHWLDDYRGEVQTEFSLFWEYLEIVLQYGFVTMFVAAFPLAPLFAFFNNILEIRVDAFNYIHNKRRPVAERAENIGAWYDILDVITKVSVFINAFVIAFTSGLIPRLVYRFIYSPDRSLVGFIDWSLSYFNVADFHNESLPLNATSDGIPVQPRCRYPGFHEPSYPYNRSIEYWIILSARLGFTLTFVVFVLSISWFIAYLIPDVPKNLELKLKREQFLEQQSIREHKKKNRKTEASEENGHKVEDQST